MNILLDGVIEEKREEVKDLIENIFSRVFNDEDIFFLEEINIPNDFSETINKTLKKYLINRVYESKGYMVVGKTISQHGKSSILLNNNLYKNGIISSQEDEVKFFMQNLTIFHELMHAKIDSEIYRKFGHFEEYNDNFVKAFNLWDEYNAVKNTTEVCYHESQITYAEYLVKLVTNEYYNVKDVLKEVDKYEDVYTIIWGYLDKVTACLVTVFGIYDGLINRGEDYESYFNNEIERFKSIMNTTFLKDIYDKIWVALKSINGIPDEDDIFRLEECLFEIVFKFLSQN